MVWKKAADLFLVSVALVVFGALVEVAVGWFMLEGLKTLLLSKSVFILSR